MFYFNDCKCSACGIAFNESDDIVTCPVCGSPHHRICYKENGGCVNEQLHEDGYSWQREIAADSEDGGTSSKNVVCGICGTDNAAGRLYCQNCGKALFEDTINSDGEESAYKDFNRQNYDFAKDEKIEDISVSDMNRFLGSSALLYTPIFYQMSKYNKKVSFNLISLIFPSFWYINRKMYFHGLFIILCDLARYLYLIFFEDIYLKVYNASMSFDSDALMSVFNEHRLVSIGFIAFGLLAYVFNIGSALFGNRLYMNWSIKKIRKLRSKAENTDEYNASLDAYGKSNFGITFAILLAYFAATLLIERFL